MTVNISILYQNSDLTQSKIYYSNTRHRLCINRALLALRSILHFKKNSKHQKNWCISSHYATNWILLIHRILNSGRTKVYYSDARYSFCITLPWLAWRFLLYFRKNFKHGNKLENFSIKDDRYVSIFCQSSGFTSSIVFFSNTRYQFYMKLALLSLRVSLHLRKIFKCNTKGAYLSVKYDC